MVKSRFKHFLNISSLKTEEIVALIDLTLELKREFLDENKPTKSYSNALKDKLIISAFFENSTRTLSSFETASKRLGASFVRLDIAKSSTAKGESLKDTIRTLMCMKPEAIIMRHHHSGASKYASDFSDAAIINAGDGEHSHPSQALLDAVTLKEKFGKLEGLHIGIIGDIKSSRVARSDIEIFAKLGVKVSLIAPLQMLPSYEIPNVSVYHSFALAPLSSFDALIALRIQNERHNVPIYASLKDYASEYCVTDEIMQKIKKDGILLHPGPIRRDVDLSDETTTKPYYSVEKQVENGIFARMAILKYMLGD